MNRQRGLFRLLLDDGAVDTRRRVLGIYGILLAMNVSAWMWAAFAFRHYHVLLGTAFLAYTFGLRHAVDADHIAAIDNVTRKLMQEGKRPVAVGFMFSLGHATVVLVGSAAIAATTLSVQHRMGALKQVGGIAGTLVSTLFLFGIAIVNLMVFRSLLAAFRAVRSGGKYSEEDCDILLGSRGVLSRLFRPMFALISRSWHMYPLGVLFGLGFDTATEIGILGISAAEASKGLSMWSILVFPALFAAGMALIDTTDSILMLGAYGWAFAKPVRKLYYNMTITLMSVFVAILVGAIEAAGLFAARFHFQGRVWTLVAGIDRNFSALGCFIIGLFAASWILSVWIYKWRRYDDFEAKKMCKEPVVSQF